MCCRLVIGNRYLLHAQMKELANLLPALGSVHTALCWVKGFLERSSDTGAAHLLLVAPEVAWVDECYSERLPRDSTHR